MSRLLEVPVKKILIAVTVGAATLVGALMTAGSAAAAANPAIVHFDTAYSGRWNCVSSSTSLRANPGDPFTLSWTSGQSSSASFRFAGPSGDIDVPMSTSTPSVVRFTELGTYQLVPAYSFNCALTVSIVAEPVAAPPPHDYFQQVGVPASGDCAKVSPTVGHWPGFPIGGWSKSWAAWINDGRGGPVCTREVEVKSDGTVVLIG